MSIFNKWKLEKSRDRAVYAIQGAIYGNRIRTYWWGSRKNFGDLLTPALFRAYGYTPVYAKKNQAELLCTGSILDGVSQTFSGMVLGSGLIRDCEVCLPKARFLAVRGYLSRQRLGLDRRVPLGDPGLLAGRLLKGRVEKKFRIGVVPHYADKDDPRLNAMLSRHGADAALIDPEAYPESVVRQIACCEVVMSSSLHGIIVAHALGIPSIWIQLSGAVAGGGFKFKDYASSVDMELIPVDLDPRMGFSAIASMASSPDACLVAKRVSELDRLFRSLPAPG